MDDNPTFDFEGTLVAASPRAGQQGGAQAQHPAGPQPGDGQPAGGPYQKNWRQTVCTYWLRGLCMRGDACGFLHQYDRERMPVCRAFARTGVCNEPDCPYKHTLGDIKECNMYKLGFCVYGPHCRYRHTWAEGPPPPAAQAALKLQELHRMRSRRKEQAERQAQMEQRQQQQQEQQQMQPAPQQQAQHQQPMLALPAPGCGFAGGGMQQEQQPGMQGQPQWGAPQGPRPPPGAPPQHSHPHQQQGQQSFPQRPYLQQQQQGQQPRPLPDMDNLPSPMMGYPGASMGLPPPFLPAGMAQQQAGLVQVTSAEELA